MKKITGKDKRKLRNRKKLKEVNIEKYRVSVFKSLKNISAQIIDDSLNKTVVSASSIEKDIDISIKDRKSMAEVIGKNIAIRSIEKGIKEEFLQTL